MEYASYFIKTQPACARGLQYSVCLSVSHSVILSHNKSRFGDGSLPKMKTSIKIALDILSPFNVPEFFFQLFFLQKKLGNLGRTIVRNCW